MRWLARGLRALAGIEPIRTTREELTMTTDNEPITFIACPRRSLLSFTATRWLRSASVSLPCAAMATVGQRRGRIWDDNEELTGAECERIAAADPDHLWQIVMYGPLSGATFTRQDDGRWILTDSNEGFA